MDLIFEYDVQIVGMKYKAQWRHGLILGAIATKTRISARDKVRSIIEYPASASVH